MGNRFRTLPASLTDCRRRSISRIYDWDFPANLFAAFGLIVEVGRGPFRLKVFDGLRNQGKRKVIFDGRPETSKRHKLPIDGLAPVTHGVVPLRVANPTNVGSFLFLFILLKPLAFQPIGYPLVGHALQPGSRHASTVIVLR